MSRPTTLPQAWATNTNFAGGPNVGTPTKIAASGGRIADGWRNTDVPPSQEQNYWQNLMARWALYQADFIGEGDTATMVARVPTFEGALFHVHDPGGLDGWYYWTTTPVATADEAYWIFSGTGGQWVSLAWKLVYQDDLRVAGVGVIPGLSGSTAGRILKRLVPYGYLTHTVIAPTTLTTTSASTTHELMNINLGVMVSGDHLRCRLPAVAGVSAGAPLAITASVYLSEDNGGSYTGKAPGGAATAYYVATTTAAVAVVLDFDHIVGANSGVRISVRGSIPGGNTLSVYLGPGQIEIIRP